MKSDPLLSDLEKKIKDMISTNKSFDIKSSTNQDIFLSKITLNSVEIPTVTEDKQQKYVQFINPELKGTINYLKDTEAGLPNDPFLDPRYSFDKGKLVLNALPTPSSITIPTPGLRGSSTRSGLSGSTTMTTYDDIEEEEGTGEGEEEGTGEGEEEEGEEEDVEKTDEGANDTGTTEGFYSYPMKNFYNW
jgi:hypothetical protein